MTENKNQKKKYGIVALKKVTGFAIGTAGQLYEVFEDGVLKWGESLSFLPTLQEIPDLIKSFPDVPKELGDLDQEEATELVEFVKRTFDIPADKVEETIEEALDLFIRGYLFAKKVKERFQKK